MKKAESTNELSLAQLGEQTETPLRTIRYYIARGLVSGPFKAGRGASYGEEHLKQLDDIKKLQAVGMTLTEIAVRLAGEARSIEKPVLYMSYQIASDVSVQVRADVNPWRLRQIQRVLSEAANKLAGPTAKGDDLDDKQ